MYRIVTYHSDPGGGTYFKDRAEVLAQSCMRLGISLYSIHMDSDNWLDAVRSKPLAIRAAMEDIRQPFFFLDCDCSVLKAVDFDLTRWGVMLREDGSAHDFIHYVPYTEEARQIVTRWIKEVEGHSNYGSHTAFHRATEAEAFDIIPDGYFELAISDTESKTETYPNHV